MLKGNRGGVLYVVMYFLLHNERVLLQNQETSFDEASPVLGVELLAKPFIIFFFFIYFFISPLWPL